ncbi:MAG: ABC transporter permease, partial [Cyclobacteriaceae bacterium]
MFFHHLKFFVRKVRKDFFPYSINLLGLIIGLSMLSLLGLYTHRQFTYGTFAPDHQRIYRVHLLSSRAGDEVEFALSYGLLAEKLMEEFPQVESATRLMKTQGESVFRVNDQEFNIAEGTAFYIDQNFFNVFDLPLLAGSKEVALNQPNAIVISKSFAVKLFGDEDPMGQMVQNVWGEDSQSLIVTGVLQDLPNNSHFQFDYLLSGRTMGETWDYLAGLNSGNSSYVYFKSDQPISKEIFDNTLSKSVADLLQKPIKLKSLNLAEIHFHTPALFEHASTSNRDQIILIGAAGLILFLASFFNSLTIHFSQLLDRRKEFGVRKALGISKTTWISQFLTESFISMLLVAIASIITAYYFHIFFFSGIMGENLLQQVTGLHWVFFLGVIMFMNLVTCSISLLRLKSYSGHVSVDVSSDKRTNSSQNHFMLVAQYSFAMLTVIGSYFVWQQLNHLQNLDIGYQSEWRINIARPNGVE